jgi:hypothetical protein
VDRRTIRSAALSCALTVVSLLLPVARSRADQCELVSPSQAQAALRLLAPGSAWVIDLCEPCGQTLTPDRRPYMVRSARAAAAGTGTQRVYINDRTVDLAYVYVHIGYGIFSNLGALSTCDVVEVSPSVFVPAWQPPSSAPPTAASCGSRRPGPGPGTGPATVTFERSGASVGTVGLALVNQGAWRLLAFPAGTATPTPLFELADDGLGAPSVAWFPRSDGTVFVTVAGASTRSALGMLTLSIDVMGNVTVVQEWRGLHGDEEPGWACPARDPVTATPRGRVSISSGDIEYIEGTGSLGQDPVMQMLLRHRAEFQTCYESELTRQPMIRGEMVIALTIETYGRTSARVVGSPFSTAMGSCVASAVNTSLFSPGPDGGSVTFSAGIHFEPATSGFSEQW